MPHRPNPEALQALASLLPSEIERKGRQNEPAFLDRNARHFAELAELWFIRGELEYFLEQPVDRIVGHVRGGIREIRCALRLGFQTNGWKMWDYFTYALAVGPRTVADLIASTLDRWWGRPHHPPGTWLHVQVRIGLALHRGADPEASALLDELHQRLFLKPMPEELANELPGIHNVYHLLRALRDRDAAAFNRILDLRTKLRADYFGRVAPAAPAALLDLAGLGLCRLALSRGMRVDVRHVYLPLEVLNS